MILHTAHKCWFLSWFAGAGDCDSTAAVCSWLQSRAHSDSVQVNIQPGRRIFRTTITGTAVRQSLRLTRLGAAAWLLNHHHKNCWGTCTFPPQTPEAHPTRGSESSAKSSRLAIKATDQHRDTRTTAAYRVVWPQPLGRRSSVFRMQHVEQTYLVRMLLTLRKKENEKEYLDRNHTGVLENWDAFMNMHKELCLPPPQTPVSSSSSSSLHFRRILTCQTTLPLVDCRWCTNVHAVSCSRI